MSNKYNDDPMFIIGSYFGDLIVIACKIIILSAAVKILFYS